MRLRNLTPHLVVLRDHDDRPVTLQPEGIVPRREVIRRDGGLIGVAGTDHDDWAPTMAPDATLHVSVESLGPVEGLPDPEDGVLLIVSRLVAKAVPYRRDVFAPGEAVRDRTGRIIGARGLCRVVPDTIRQNLGSGPALPAVGEIQEVYGVSYAVTYAGSDHNGAASVILQLA